MALTTLDGLVAAMAGATVQRRRTSGNPTLASQNRWFDLFLAASNPLSWGQGALPGSLGASALTDHSTAGAIPYTNPAGGNTGYLAHLAGYASQGGTLVLYDRLWHANVDASINTLQTLSGATMTRPDGNGTDVELWLEADPASNPGAFGTNTLTVLYTNQAGTGSRSGVAGSSAANGLVPSTLTNGSAPSMWPMKLQAGDYGVRSVQSAQFSSAIGTGHVGLVLLRRLGALPVAQNFLSAGRDLFQLGLSRVDSGACLAVMYNWAAGSTAFLSLQLGLVEG